MVEKNMRLLAERHSDWVKIVRSFGCDRELAEDITQEMYIKIQLKLEDGLDIAYEDELNYYYIFKTLRTLFLDLMRKKKNIYKVDIEQINNLQEIEQINYTEKYDLIIDELDKMYWYDKKVFLLIDGGESIASLARKTGIPYYSLYNTYKRVKDKLKDLL